MLSAKQSKKGLFDAVMIAAMLSPSLRRLERDKSITSLSNKTWNSIIIRFNMFFIRHSSLYQFIHLIIVSPLKPFCQTNQA